jgi:hypothetical protein
MSSSDESGCEKETLTRTVQETSPESRSSTNSPTPSPSVLKPAKENCAFSDGAPDIQKRKSPSTKSFGRFSPDGVLTPPNDNDGLATTTINGTDDEPIQCEKSNGRLAFFQG